ncbi:MAG: potassium/proton antiporter [Chloroflexota bacterium]|nr:potassium/proton antiporter [Chloroflexota bacterium]
MLPIEHVLVAAAVLLLLSVVASKASSRVGVPALLLFLAIGMLAGSEGPGGISFDNVQFSQSLGVIALAFILFSGGLDTDWPSVRPALWSALGLSTVGVCLSALLVAWVATVVLRFTFLEGVLLGAIVSSTDAAAVFAVLRTRGVHLKGQIEPLLELESGSNDPMAVFLTVGLTQVLMQPGNSVLALLPTFVLQMVLGAVLGYGFGRGAIALINRVRLQVEGLYPVVTVAVVLLIYGATAALGGNGFLAVYLAALVMGNHDFVHKRSLLRFHDGLAWLMQISMFLSLGLLVFPSRLVPVMGGGVLVALFLVFVARPVSVLVSLGRARFSIAEKLMVAWVGLRGAVPIILTTFPLLAGVPQAETMFNVVFFIVLTSVLVQGTSLPLVARWLHVEAPTPPRPPRPHVFMPTVSALSQMAEVVIPPDSPLINRAVVDLALPPGALLILIHRGDETIVPNGGTVLAAGDRVLVLADRDLLAEVQARVARHPRHSDAARTDRVPRAGAPPDGTH